MHAVVLADSPSSDVQTYYSLIQEADLLVAADGAAAMCIELNLVPHIVIGDFDSLAPELLEQLAQGSSEIQRYPRNKDETDLELALLVAVDRGATSITILGAFGGRPDMHFAHHSLLGHAALQDCDVAIRGFGWITKLLEIGSLTLKGSPGLRVSLIPARSSPCVSTQGLLYPLTQGDLVWGSVRGVSNEFLEHTAIITVHSGSLFIFYEDVAFLATPT